MESKSHPRSVWTAGNFVFTGNLICSEAWWKVSQASGISKWWHLECVLQQYSGQIKNISKLNERMTFMQSIFSFDWHLKREGLRKQIFVFCREKRVVVFYHVAPLCIKKVDESENNSHVQNNTALKCAKNYANWCNCFKDMGNQSQWPHLIV